MSLRADIAVRLGEFDLDVTFEAGSGETVALLGPNGAGKSTVLRCIAGLLALDSGRIEVAGRTIDDPASGVRLAPQERAVGMVFQDHLLFPSMSVAENVAFGPRARGVARGDARRRAGELLELVGLGGRGGDRPSQLSGGQRQRVALARALAIDPDVVLLDEPLAALDVTTRAEIRRELRRHLDRLTDCVRLLVTHDPVDAFALADRLIVIEHGRVTQVGTIADVAARPATPYVADLLGVNLLRGLADHGTVRLEGGGEVRIADENGAGDMFVLIRPSSVSLHRDRPDTSARNRWRCEIVGFDLQGDHVRVRLAGEIDLVAEVTPSAVTEMGLAEGRTVWASAKATDVTAYSA
ncbi:MAG: ABC transporter ATP-binding protein [Acidimicrobiales bacterium]